MIGHCRAISRMSEEPGRTTRTFLSPPMHDVHQYLRAWMERAGMAVSIDAVGNLRGVKSCGVTGAPRLVIGSHLDTVPNAGAFDGILGVVMGVGLIERLAGAKLAIDIEVVGFSEEEGVRFAMPFIGSLAYTGQLHSVDSRIAEAIRDFGLDPARIPEAAMPPGAIGYLEFHIEQGPVLESLGLPLGVVECIAGQSRFNVTFQGKANHAGTTPMHLRQDAVAAAAEWILQVEATAINTQGLVATVGRLAAQPGAGNVIAGVVEASLDVRHAEDAVRLAAVDSLRERAYAIASRRGLTISFVETLSRHAVKMDPMLTALLEKSAGCKPPRMTSGAGHDAMILAPLVPSTMLFLRSPGGISHHPDENVFEQDIEAAMQTGLAFIPKLNQLHSGDPSCNI